MKRIILLIACLLTILSLNAKDDYRYRNITMNDGLTANAVRNIVQDKYGFIWFGTDNGLCRYDGKKVQPYRLAELGTSQYVSALMAGDEGLFVGTQKGQECSSGTAAWLWRCGIHAACGVCLSYLLSQAGCAECRASGRSGKP